jgi:lysozyme
MTDLDWKQETDGKWYCYKNSQKIMGWVSDDKNKWYHLNDKNGQLDTGFFQTATDNDLWFYGYPEKTEKDGDTHYTGEACIGWCNIDNNYYYFYPEKTEKDGDTHYQSEMAIDWIELDSKWYYLLTQSDASKSEYKGQMVCNCTRTIDGKSYEFNEDGSLKEESSNYILSSDGAKFIGSWEGFWSQAKYDPYYPNDKRYITIGYGTTYSAIPSAFNSDNPLNTTCTVEEATQWLQEEAQTCAESIKEKLDDNNVTLPVNAIDALISFSYNCGTGALFNSTLWRNIINGVTDRDTISANFCAYSKANGITSQGLLKRRKSEVSLFFDSDYTGNN